MARLSIYESLIAHPDDVIGAFAYIIYKRQKIDFCRSFPSGTPSRDELERFDVIAALDTSIASYRAGGEEMAQAFLVASLDRVVGRVEADTRQSVLYKYIGGVNAGLEGKLAVISDTLLAKRTWRGWVRDVGANLLLNLITILVIGTLVFGYRMLGELQKEAEKKTGLAPASAQGSAPARSTGP